MDAEKLLLEALKGTGFSSDLAYQIAERYGDKLMDDFGNEVTKKLGEYVDKTVEAYIKDWAVDENIKRRVGAVFRNIDKVELLAALRDLK